MTEQHLITPPPELLQEWCQQGRNCISELDALKELATQAARWGADQELEACVEWLYKYQYDKAVVLLLAARRPKPPSLKEQALLKTTAILNDPNRALLDEVREALELNRRALEALPDD
jgi:hypothetical protein